MKTQKPSSNLAISSKFLQNTFCVESHRYRKVGQPLRLEQQGRGDVDLAYCPERIVQGQSLVELERLPQLIGGTTPRAAQRSAGGMAFALSPPYA